MIRIEHLGQAEIGHLGPAVAGQENIGGLQVAMDNPSLVRLGHRVGEHEDEPGCIRRRPWRTIEMSVETAPDQVFEFDERLSIDLAHMIDLDDIRMTQTRDRRGLRPESGEGGSDVVRAGLDHLERAEPVEGQLRAR